MLLSLLLSALPTLPDGDEVPSVWIPRIPDGVERPVIDGRFGEEVWDHAVEIGELRQVEPVAGAEASERTEVRLTYDSRSVFLMIRCYDSDPSGVRGTQRQRDARLNPDDRVEFLFDTFHDRRNAFWFQIGAGGSKGDALITKNGSSFNKEWDTIWFAKVRVDNQGWHAEIEIPVNSINFDPEGTTWGFNLRREIKRKNETLRWASATPTLSFFSIANAGILSGVEDLEQGLGVEVIPFASGDAVYDRVDDREYLKGDAGVDLFYSITPNFKLSLSYNTDFAETEVDERRVNLTRFNLFFPEKRDFFLEDSGNFFFGPGSGRGRTSDVIPFFSRRIGLDDDGSEVPILLAGKLTGQTDDFSVGIMDVQTDDLHELDGQNLFVARVSKNVFEQSDVGMIWTRGDPNGMVDSNTYGVDFNYRTDKFLEDRNFRVNTYLLRSPTEGVRDDDFAGYLGVSYPNDEVDLHASYLMIEDSFDPLLGFVRRGGIKRYSGRFYYRPRLHSDIRQLRFGFEPVLYTDTGNDLETVDIELQPFGFELESGDEFETEIEFIRDVLDEPFDITDDVTVPTDRYDWTRFGIGFETSSKRLVEVEASYETGGFYDGRRSDYMVGATVRPSGLLNFGFDYELNDVRLDDGNFKTRISRARVNFTFTPEVSWSNFVQYDNVSDSIGLNSRLWIIVKPGHEIFIVLNQGWDYRPDDRFRSTSTQLTGKVTYTLRF